MSPSHPTESQLYLPNGTPCCRFDAGSLHCLNRPCRNPNHRTSCPGGRFCRACVAGNPPWRRENTR